jgi:anti-sigma regulatory factor (Ser/Thr protein kinase)
MTSSWPDSTLELGALPEAVPCARASARVMLLIWDRLDLREPVELLVSELLSNAVKATWELTCLIPPPVRMRLSYDGTRVLIEVWDASPQPPVPAEADFLAEGGRGLHLVEAISGKWASYPAEHGGKVVWSFVEISD